MRRMPVESHRRFRKSMTTCILPLPKSDRFLLAMFARQGCDKAVRELDARPAPVAKLQSSRDIVVRLLIRGTDEYATDRRSCPQQQDAGSIDNLGQGFCVLV